jgi:NADH-quinone oxidoreductase subunit N
VAFKLSVVPMHVWTPDVYQGAPTPVAAFISVASKAAGFVFAIRLFPVMLAALSGIWVPLLSVLALVTMTAGNLMAIPQKNVKRFLAYSTISQAGYILVGFVGASEAGISSVVFYLLVYAVSNMAAFGVAAAFAHSAGSDDLEDYNGLARREPVLALVFLTALLSLAGIPPLAGFIGKFYLFYASMQQGYAWLVIAAALNSTVSLYYYLAILKRMYIFEGKKDAREVRVPATIKAALAISVAAMLVLGLFPGPVIAVTTNIGRAFFPH